ncbi:family 2 glycosyl transferase [Natronococcus amylolyticus DSM 10524]|uniref:Family 2 glycosyl transferase n=1 Tax=Natronococcus amylolyticus DSM 10524 TaxID=1227497 RepID=L9WYS7_9EURY|nr:glycosyltransferase family 2 protein [Natronococcus amylolyticus]ELY54562.1 family 2 glycosyl transferase [Natronococcus amylolyticus DSM 10524]
MATVSVVIPTYERPAFLEGAVETALAQTYDDLEVIVVDDGSETDYLGAVVDEYPERVVGIEHEENRGLSAARNTGIERASGECVAFLDDDDRWHETKIERQVRRLESDDRVGLVTCLSVSVTPDGEVIHVERDAPSGDLSDAMLRKNLLGSPSRVLARRAALEEADGFDENLPTKQDWDLYIRLCQRWHVGAVDDHLCFRTSHESMSSSPEAVTRDYRAVLEKHESLIRERGYWEPATAAVAERAGRAYLDHDELRSARSALKAALYAEPTKRRAALLALSYTHPAVVRSAIAATRYLRSRRDSSGFEYGEAVRSGSA